MQSGNTEVAEPEKESHSLINTIRRGEAPILIRYEGNYTATTVTVMGDRSGFVWQQPPFSSFGDGGNDMVLRSESVGV